jgi:hypothetical protein
VLTVGLPTQDLMPSQLQDGLDALSCDASQHHHAAIAALASDVLSGG